MPKSTSTFIKSKMNKDTDSRILPHGEYRDAQNVSISKSEGADVGALENVLGNRALVNINSLLGSNVKNLEVIGHLMDVENDRIFMMLTNYSDTSPDQLSNFATTNSGHYIYCYNVLTQVSTQLVSGNFLNFSKTHFIHGINLIEDLLFWTDNRNQPRKINVQSALASPADSSFPYYTNEDHISVAKYYPYNPPRLYKTMGPFTEKVGGGTVSNTVAVLLDTHEVIQIGDLVNVSGVTLTQQHCVVGVTGGPTTQQILIDPAITYGAGAEFTFYRTEMKDVVSEFLPRNRGTASSPNPFFDGLANSLTITNGGTGYISSAGNNQPCVTLTGSGSGLIINYTTAASPGAIDSVTIVNPGSGYRTGDTVQPFNPWTAVDPILYPQDGVLTIASADTTWPGDPEFLSEKFVRFSYRYKFDDGEYSLIAPFTQSAFIPKQDGYFMADWESETGDNFDEVKAYVSTIVDFMENKVNNINIAIDNPCPPANLYEQYKIVAIELLYKESDSSNIRILESIPYTDTSIANTRGTVTLEPAGWGIGTGCYENGINPTTTSGSGSGMTLDLVTDGSCTATSGLLYGFGVSAAIADYGSGYVDGDIVYPVSGTGAGFYYTLSITDPNVFTYEYQSRKPITTIPSDQMNRVSDRVPVKALTQEVTGNRVVYANFVNKHSSPSNLNYEVKAGSKLQTFENFTNFSTVQYPNHTLKENRTYQVGVVLADRYGRQSDVVLSEIQPSLSDGFGGSTTFAQYRTAFENSNINVLNWFGNSLQIIFNQEIPSTISTPGYPGLYSTTNPTGWYSYKVVVKQQQQEYYNVYLPGLLRAYPLNHNEEDYTAFTTLYSDNVNKIPKDLNDVGPLQAQFRSDEKLWGRLENFIWVDPAGPTELHNTRQYYPSLLSDKSIKIGTMTDLDLGTIGLLRAQNINSISIKQISQGAGYNGSSPGEYFNQTTTATSGLGSGLTLDGTVAATGGLISSMFLNSSGSGYVNGDIVELDPFTGGANAQARIRGGGRTNNFLLSSYNPAIKIGMSVNSAKINGDIVGRGQATALVEGGSGYTPVANVTTTSCSGIGTGLTITINTVTPTGLPGAIATFTANAAFAGGYEVGDIVTLDDAFVGNTGTGAIFVIAAPVITNYTEYQDTDETVVNAAAIKAEMTISYDTQTVVPNDEIFLINQKGEDLFFNSKTNPYLTQLKSRYPIGIVNEAMTPSLAIYETKPTFSNLDIYWESSTSGLISDLNTAINTGDTTSPYTLCASSATLPTIVPVTFTFAENTASGTIITPSFKAVRDPVSPSFITTDIDIILVSVLNNGNDIKSNFKLNDLGSGAYQIKTIGEFVVGSHIPSNYYTFNLEIELTDGTNRSRFPFTLTHTLTNIQPTITPVAPAVCAGTLPGTISPTVDTLIATFNAVNGSISSILNTVGLTWVIKNIDGSANTDLQFELRQSSPQVAGQIELWVLPGRYIIPQTFEKRIRVQDGGGMSQVCDIEFTLQT